MKKTTLYLILSLIFSACSQDDSLVVYPNTTESTHSIRSTKEAISIAENILSLDKPNGRGDLDFKETIKVITSPLSRNGEHNDTLIYVVERNNDNGYVLIAAPSHITPVLAVVENGSFDNTETKSNSAFQYVLKATKQYVSNNLSALDPITKPVCYWDTISRNKKQEPRITTKWGQSWPENAFCTNEIAGCVPVGIAQILSYFESPSSINYTFPGKDLSSESLDWIEIKKHKRSNNLSSNFHYSSCTASKNTHATIGRLIREIGQIANASYNDSATSVSGSKVLPTIKHFLPSKSYSTGSDMVDLFNLIQSSTGVATISGINDKGSGHLWIADASWSFVQKITYYEARYKQNYDTGVFEFDGYEPTIIKDEVFRYLHYNWGDKGYNNGYFLIDIFSPDKAYEYDDSFGFPTNHDFKNSVSFIFIK